MKIEYRTAVDRLLCVSNLIETLNCIPLTYNNPIII